MPQLPQGVQLALKKTVGEDIVMLVAQTSLHAGSDEALNLVRTIRESHPPVDGELMVTGESAFHVDFIEAIKSNSPLVVGLVVLVTYLVLFLLLGSLLLPLKAVLMNMLSISASYGALVWIFQYGHLATWLQLHAGSHRGNDSNHDVLHPVWPLDGLRGAAAQQGTRGVRANMR